MPDLGRCNVTYFKQAAEMVDKGIAKSQYDAAKQIAEGEGEKPENIRWRIRDGKKKVGGDLQKESSPVISSTTNNFKKLEKT